MPLPLPSPSPNLPNPFSLLTLPFFLVLPLTFSEAFLGSSSFLPLPDPPTESWRRSTSDGGGGSGLPPPPPSAFTTPASQL